MTEEIEKKNVDGKQISLNLLIRRSTVQFEGFLYHNPLMVNFEGEKVKVDVFASDYSCVRVYLPKGAIVLAHLVLNYPSGKSEYVGESRQLLEATARLRRREHVNSQLILACEAALLLRGIAAAIRDPLAFEAEKQTYRARYVEIETEIRAAIKAAKGEEND